MAALPRGLGHSSDTPQEKLELTVSINNGTAMEHDRGLTILTLAYPVYTYDKRHTISRLVGRLSPTFRRLRRSSDTLSLTAS